MADNYNTLVLMFGQGDAFHGTQVDYDRFMEEFRKDYSQQIALTANQLRDIVNEKNVNGKGEKLSEAVRTILEKRFEKTVERNRSAYAQKGFVISPEVLSLIRQYQEKGIPLQKEPECIETPVEEEPVQEATVGEEFLKYGIVAPLWERYGDSENPLVTELLEAMENYADAMETGAVRKLESAVNDVFQKAENLVKSRNEEIDPAFCRFAEKLCEEFLVSGNVLELVEWCLGHNKVRQAAELFVAKAPEYFFDRQFIYYENYHDSKRNDGSYGDAVIDARKQAKSKSGLKYFWLNEMLWKNTTKKLYLNVDKAVLPQDGTNARRFKLIFREIRDLQETRKNKVQVEELSQSVLEMFEMIAENGYISPVLNTTKKVCNYFFNYETTGTPGSVQKNYRDLSLILLSNRDFCEHYFGEESVQIVTFTPASIAANKEQPDVKSKLIMERLELLLRSYEKIKEQVEMMGKDVRNATIMSSKELKECLQETIKEIKQ